MHYACLNDNCVTPSPSPLSSLPSFIDSKVDRLEGRMEGEKPQVLLVQQAGRVLVAALMTHVPQLLRRPQLELHRIAPLSLLFLLLVISLHLSQVLVNKKKEYSKSVFLHLLPHPGGWKRSCRSSLEARPPPTRGEAPHSGGDTPPLRRNWRRRNSEDGTVQRWLLAFGQENSNWKLDVNQAGLLSMELQHMYFKF